MIRRFLFLVLASCFFVLNVAQVRAAQDINFNGSNQRGFVSLPATAPYTSVSSLRYDLRLSGVRFNYSTDAQRLLWTNNLIVYIPVNSSTLTVALPGGEVSINLAGRTDCKIRFQRDVAANRASLEVWNADDSNYAQATAALSSTASFNESGGDGWAIGAANFLNTGNLQTRVSYCRWYTTTLTLGSPAPLSYTPGGDALDYEFEGNGNDSSSHAQTLTLENAPTFSTTAAAAPRAIVTGSQTTYKAGTALPLDCSNSSGGDYAITSYGWSIVSGPNTPSITASTASVTTTGSNTLAGEYTVRCTVTNSNAATSTADAVYGVVAVDSSDVVQIADPTVSLIIGPQLMMKSATNQPWPNFDNLQVDVAEITAANWPINPPRPTGRPGTISLTKGSAVIIGSGTHFLTDFSTAYPIQVQTYSTALLTSSITAAQTTIPVDSVANLMPQGFATIDDETVRLISRSGNTLTVMRAVYGTTAASHASGATLINNDLYQAGYVTVQSDTQMTMAQPYPYQSTSGVRYSINARNLMMGTVSTASGSTTVTGDKTRFLTEVTGGPWKFYIKDGAGAWQTFYVASVQSDTQLTLTTAPTFTVTNADDSTTVNGEDSNDFTGYTNYYDFVYVQYQLYYRTGLTRYRDRARRLADIWYAMVASEGLNRSSDATYSPRTMALGGLILRALDGRPDMWDWLYTYITDAAFFPNWVTIRKDYPGYYFGLRDGGYTLLYAIWLAASLPDTYPDYTGATVTNGAAKRAALLSDSIDGALDYYVRLQRADGSFRWVDDWNFNDTISEADDGYGQTNFHAGLVDHALEDLYRYLKANNLYAPEANTLRQSLLNQCSSLEEGYNNQVISGFPTAGVRWRSMPYNLYSLNFGNPVANPNAVFSGDVNDVRGARHNGSTTPHVFGFCYNQTGYANTKAFGDELIAAQYGKGLGLNADSLYGLQDFYYRLYTNSSAKEYNESYRASGRYVAWRVMPPVTLPRPLPLANAGPDRDLPSGVTSFTVAGAGGLDPAGGTVTYLWTIRNPVSGVVLNNATTAAPTLAPTGSTIPDGNYNLREAVTNSFGDTVYDYITVTVSSRTGVPLPVTVNAGAPQTVNSTSATLTCAVTNAANGTAYVKWVQESGPSATIVSPYSAVTTVNALTAGTTPAFRCYGRDQGLYTNPATTNAFADTRLTVSGAAPPPTLTRYCWVLPCP